MLNCLMYKLCYYRFGEMSTQGMRGTGYDRARNYESAALRFPSIRPHFLKLVTRWWT